MKYMTIVKFFKNHKQSGYYRNNIFIYHNPKTPALEWNYGNAVEHKQYWLGGIYYGDDMIYKSDETWSRFVKLLAFT